MTIEFVTDESVEPFRARAIVDIGASGAMPPLVSGRRFVNVVFLAWK
jgi:hypothetical protein